MAPKAVLSSVVFHDHRIPGGSKGSRFVRAPGDGARGRELLRLRLGESACGSLLAPGSELLLTWPLWRLPPPHTYNSFSRFITERNRNPDVSQRNSDDEEQESK